MDRNGDEVIQFEGTSRSAHWSFGCWCFVMGPDASFVWAPLIFGLVEFRTFVEKTEKELLNLFQSIDRDHDGRLDKNELRAAFKRAGLAVPKSKLDNFFSEIDQNNDVSSGHILLFFIQMLISSRDSYHFLNGGKLVGTSKAVLQELCR